MSVIETIEVPWSLAGTRAFARDFAARRRADGPAEVVVIARNSTETAWFQELAERATAVCFIRGRGPKIGAHYATQGMAAMFYGTDVEGFKTAWADRGVIWTGRRVHRAETEADQS
jgi:hypothetical protein